MALVQKKRIDICTQASIEKSKRVNELNEEEISKIRELVDNKIVVEGDLRREISTNIKRLNDLGSLTEVYVIEKNYLYEDKEHIQMLVQEKGKLLQLQVRKKF